MVNNNKLNILVGLDLTSTDEYILGFLSRNLQAFHPKNLSFIHVSDNLSAEQMNQAENELKAKIRSSGFSGESVSDVHVIENEDPEKVVKDWSQKHQTDLLVIGIKQTDDHEVKPGKLVRKPTSSLLLIPENKSSEFRRIGIALDFTEFAKEALLQARALADAARAELLGIYAYQVPSGYHKTGKDHKEFAKEMEENARQDAQEFFDKTGVDNIDMHYVYDQENDPAQYIARFAEDKQVDLLVVGSRGRTGMAEMLMGSVGKDLIGSIKGIPMLIIKEKNERMNLLDALKNI